VTSHRQRRWVWWFSIPMQPHGFCICLYPKGFWSAHKPGGNA